MRNCVCLNGGKYYEEGCIYDFGSGDNRTVVNGVSVPNKEFSKDFRVSNHGYFFVKCIRDYGSLRRGYLFQASLVDGMYALMEEGGHIRRISLTGFKHAFEETDEGVPFTKDDLRCGMRVEFDKDTYIVTLDDEGKTIAVNKSFRFICFSTFDDELKGITDVITRVWNAPNTHGKILSHDFKGDLVFERIVKDYTYDDLKSIVGHDFRMIEK